MTTTGDDSTQGMDSQQRTEVMPLPKRIGRYKIGGVLGTGGFGAVLRATDQTLHRDVAIKVPRRKAGSVDELTKEWTAEAQVASSLDHPNIVPVYDVGSTAELPFYVVAKLIDGTDLRQRVTHQQPSVEMAVGWVASIADALHYAHTRGLVHRDVKPSNILIDADNHPWLTDFGLALHESDLGKGPTNLFVGTFSYMSPEQARGEGHLVDGRADIFSLGIVLYELLTGSRPFQGTSSRQLLTNIVRSEPRPLRLRVPKLPIELERICLKALAKRVSDRYRTADDMAGDLRWFIEKVGMDGVRSPSTDSAISAEEETVRRGPDSTTSSDPAVIPKGLRPFDEHDWNFFLKLVPGPRDANGVPEVIRQWKTRIESPKEEETFRVGLIYGASGSGKSSLVRAGLIPHLDHHLQIAYVEATARDTEARLLRALPPADDDSPTQSLVARIASLRQSLSPHRKVLIVLDQFEQWLHWHHLHDDSVLINALRQCDGLHVQCIVMIRDDFWMDATRFFHELDIRLVDGVNVAAVDRFDLRHARFVLTEFGRAYGCLPDDPRDLSDAQSRFLDEVIDSVQEEGKVISIHLVLLAQMLRSRDWVPETLSQFGGTDGIGIDFLNATFASDSASPLHRSVQMPARAVLGALLPEAGSNIKGQRQNAATLRRVSELNEQDFQELLEVLDGQLRLITPTVGPDDSADDASDYYQLTHDFLVPALRSWLTQKQRETAKGRAKLRMQELGQWWRRKPESRFLPDVFEYLRIAILTSRSDRNKDEKKMMAAAARHHAMRWGAAALLIIAVVFLGTKFRQRRESDLLVKQLLAARVDEVLDALRQLQPVASDAQVRLRGVIDSDSATPPEVLRARMALLGSDEGQVKSLAAAVPQASTDDVVLLADLLRPYAKEVGELLWDRFPEMENDQTGWLHVAYMLAELSPADPRWEPHCQQLAETISNQNPLRLSRLAEGFGSLGSNLARPLADVYGDSQRNLQQRINAAVALAECCDDDALLNDLVCTALPSQFEILFPLVRGRSDSLQALLAAELQQQPSVQWPDTQIESQPLTAAIRQKFEMAAGMITADFAVCQSLPSDQFDLIADEIRSLGYRPACIRPYAGDGQETVAAVWHRDGRDWQFSRLDDADQLAEQEQAMRSVGLMPTDVTRLPPGASEKQSDESLQRYGVLWVAPDRSMIADARIYIGVSESDHQSAWGPLNDGGYVPKSNLKFHSADGSARYSSVRLKMRTNPSYVDAWDDTPHDYASRILDGWHQVDVRLNPNESVAAVWWNGGPMESQSVQRMPIADQQKRFAQLSDEGYRPVSISVDHAPGGAEGVSVWHRPVIRQQQRDHIASRQANAVITLFQLGDTEHLWPALENQPDARLRSFLIDRLLAFGIDPAVLIEKLLDKDLRPQRRFAIIAALGKIHPQQLPADLTEKLRAEIRRLGTTDPSAAIHSVCEYFSGQMEWAEILEEISSAATPESADSFKDSTGVKDRPVTWQSAAGGHTLAVIRDPREFKMGSPGHEEFRDHHQEVTRRVRIPRSFAISTTEVTVDQFRNFRSRFGYASDYTPSPQCPANSISWYDAARYCRWLCEQEDMDKDQMPYPPIDEIVPGVRLPPDFLQRTGYRLPTSAEWEYACRATSHTSRHYGNSDEILDRYAWTVENSGYQLQPVGTLLPNDFGLFDMLGNAKEWCQDEHSPNLHSTKAVHLDTDHDRNIPESIRISRGGAFLYAPFSARSASQEPGTSTRSNPYLGFRIARTVKEQ